MNTKSTDERLEAIEKRLADIEHVIPSRRMMIIVTCALVARLLGVDASELLGAALP